MVSMRFLHASTSILHRYRASRDRHNGSSHVAACCTVGYINGRASLSSLSPDNMSQQNHFLKLSGTLSGSPPKESPLDPNPIVEDESSKPTAIPQRRERRSSSMVGGRPLDLHATVQMSPKLN